MATQNFEKFTIQSQQGNYDVSFASAASDFSETLSTHKNVVFIVDAKVHSLHAAELDKIFSGRPVYLVHATEAEKTLEGSSHFCTWLQSQNATRNTTLVVIGGGITQDIASFSAHIYYRGLKWLFFPTTLLSMSDSCIGGKCTINHNQFKNQLGVFYPPAEIFICSDFLSTLDEQDVASGYGEITKLFLTENSWQNFAELKAILQKEGLRNSQIVSLLKRALLIKKKVIEEDEYETSYRRILNYGHTFGHALESITHHEIPHGLAVLWGMDLINFLSFQRGLLSEKHFLEIHHFIKEFFPFSFSKNFSVDDLIVASKRDKKVSNQLANLIFLLEKGELQITACPYDATLEKQLRDYVASWSVYKARA